MRNKKTAVKRGVKKPLAQKEPKPGSWASIVKGAAYAKKAGLQNWPG